jgi:hypothetical protein
MSVASSAFSFDRPSGNNGPRKLPESVYQIPTIRPPKQSFRPLQKWRGTVIDIRESEFDAELQDQTDSSRPREAATFRYGELSDDDQHLVEIGAVFYWSIGYELTPSRQRKLVSTIIVRRLPAWTKSEIDAVEKRAAEIEGLLGIENAARKTA